MSPITDFIDEHYSDQFLLGKPGNPNVYDPSDGTLWSLESVGTHYTSATGYAWPKTKERLFVSSMPYVKKMVFDPALPSGITKTTYNKYKTYKPINPASQDLSLWFEYLGRLFPNQDDRYIVVSYLSHIIQRPWERPDWHIIITGDFGTGKSSLFELINVFMEDQTTSYNSYSALSKDHSLDFEDKIAIAVDDPRQAIHYSLEPLKELATKKNVKVNPKGKDMRKVKTYCRFFIFSNKSNPVTMEPNERRWWAPAYGNHRIDKHETINWLKDSWGVWLKNGGYEAIYNYLVNYDISDFIISYAPYSKLIDEWKVNNLTEDDFIFEAFIEKSKVFTTIEFKAKTGMTSNREVDRFLKNKGYVFRRPFHNNPDYRIYNGVQVWRPSSMTPDECREIYLSHTMHRQAVTNIKTSAPASGMTGFTTNATNVIQH